MRRGVAVALMGGLAAGMASCITDDTGFPPLPFETRFAFLNFSTRYYAVLGFRPHADDGEANTFARTPLLPPGAIYRADFLDFIPEGCPSSLDFQLLLYRRVNDGQDPPVPIGMDPGEEVEPVPVAAGWIDDIPGPCCERCSDTVGVYTVVNWEAPEGVARVKFAQDSAVDAVIHASGRFDNRDDAWEIEGVDAALADASPPAPMATDRVAGRVTLADGTGVADVLVLLRTRFRYRLNDNDPGNDPDAGFGDPIDFAVTDVTGAFSFDRPAGVYEVECFSDGFLFRPPSVEVESPITTIQIIVEPE